MGKFNDLTGIKFGYWTVVGKAPKKEKRLLWHCICECGTERDIESYNLTHGHTISCGCKTKRPNLLGKKFNRLTVIEYIGVEKNHRMWRCRCECGNQLISDSARLIGGYVKSCGCINVEAQLESHFKHGMSNTRLHRIWSGIKKRCFNSNVPEYKNYGGRGIKMCDEWKDNFSSFYEWSILHGYNDKLSIDRIDVNGNYDPKNCRWVDDETQRNNKRNNRYALYKGQKMTIAQVARKIGIPSQSLYYKKAGQSGIKDLILL